MKSYYILFLYFIIVTLFSNCNLVNYDYSNQPLTFKEKNTLRIQDSIQSILQKKYNENYLPYSFGKLTTNKPNEFLELDSLYELRKTLVLNKKISTSEKDSLLKSLNNKIDISKESINEKKLYHTYEIEHIFLVKSDINYKLHELNYTLYPNYTIKKEDIKLSTTLNKKEKELFNYFSLQNPLFETEDSHYNNQMDQLVYTRFTNALINETNNKEELLHTILYCVEYIRKYNSFDEQDVAQWIAQKWLTKHNLTDFIPKFDKLEKILSNYEISGYSLKAINRKGNESILFNFDLNLVIINTTKK